MTNAPQLDLTRLNVPDLIARVYEFRAGLIKAGAKPGEVEPMVLAFQQSLLFAQITKMGQPEPPPFQSGSMAYLIKSATVLLADFDRGEIIPLSEVGEAVTAMISFHFDDLREALKGVA